MSKIVATTVNIATGASLSAAANLQGAALVGIIMPAAWTTANLTFQASQDDATYRNVYDNLGAEVTVIAVAAYHIVIAPAAWLNATYLKVRSGTAGTPVTQTRTGGTDIILLTQEF